ncbi:MAG: TonB-dependent receptor plug domain-containing protein, partial [Proteobacteria bacterium]|nr:TonB-dependent receptor plug domain-containing protein [Pseudomonadota bacterium]
MLDEVVVTASRNEQALRDVAVSVSVLDSDDLALSDHIHIQETMVRSAGVWVSRGNGQEHLTAIRSPVLTGAGSCGAFLISQDGIPLRAPGFCNVNELFESTSELAERIEVMKGPGSSTHGYNALHGIINVITPAPQHGLRRASLLAGPWNYLRSRLTVSSDSLRMDMSGTSDGGYKDDSGFDQQKLLLTHRHENGDQSIKTTFSYTNLNQETAGFVEGPEVYRRSGIKRDNPNPEAYRDARSFRLVSSISRTLGQSQLLLKPYARHVDMVFLQHFLPGQAVEENGHDSLGLLGLWTSALADWRLGVEIDYTRGYLKETQPGPTGISPFLDATIPAGA